MIFATKYNFIKWGKIFWALAYLAVFFLISYVGLIGLTISDIVVYDRAQGALIKLAAEITGLEEKYLDFSGEVSLSQARSLGFVDAPKTYFLGPAGELLTTRINAPHRQ